MKHWRSCLSSSPTAFNVSEGVRGKRVKSFTSAYVPSSFQRADRWHHTHHPGRSCVGRSSIVPGVINGSILVCFTQSAVQSSRTTAGQQENAGWHLYRLHSWKNWITEAVALSEVLILEHITCFKDPTSCDAFCTMMRAFKGSVLSQIHGAGFIRRAWAWGGSLPPEKLENDL